MLDAFWLDLRHAWRALGRKPVFAVGAIATLTLGIGANVTIFSIVNAMVLRPLPFGETGDRLITLHATHRLVSEEPGWGDSEISYRDLLDFREARALDQVGAHLARNLVLSGDQASAERVLGGSVTPGLFPLLGIQPMLGRQFLDEEATAPGLEDAVILTHGLWQRRYGADPTLVGRTIVVNDRARTVVGVLPPGVKFPERDELYLPLRLDEAARSSRVVNAVARLAPGVAVLQAQAELSAIAARLAAEHADTNRDVGVRVVPIRATYVGAEERSGAALMMGAVGFVLLIVCANLANLMLVRGAERQRDVAVRAAMGAGRARLMWSTLAESVLLALPGATFGLLAAQWALDWIRAAIPEELPYWLVLEMDARVALFAASVSVFTAIAVGLIPALRAARPRLAVDLRDGGRSTSLGRGGQRLQSALAVAQVALCFALLVGANLMVRAFLEQRTADLGFDDGPLLTARSYLAGDAYDDPAARAAFFLRATATLAALPGATAAAATTSVPGDDGGSLAMAVVDGRMALEDEVAVQAIGITSAFFETLGLSPIEGRVFTDPETADPASDVVLVNQSLARRLWANEPAVNRRIALRVSRGDRWFRIVGVVPDVHYEEVGESTEASRLNIYRPYAADASRSMSLIVRTSVAPDTLAEAARSALVALNAGFPVYRVMPMRDLRRFTTWEQAFMGQLMTALAVAALLLACLGVSALMSYTVGRRSKEIGVRLALGATPLDVVRMLAKESGQVAIVGTGAGLVLSVVVARALSRSFYGVNESVMTYAGMAIPLAVAMVAATWWPARRASRIDPTMALREE